MYQVLKGGHKHQSKRILSGRLHAAAFLTGASRIMALLCTAGEEGEEC